MSDPGDGRVYVLLAEIKGQIAESHAQVQGRLASIEQKIESGDRDQAQISGLLRADFGSFKERVLEDRVRADADHRRLEDGLTRVRLDGQSELAEHVHDPNPHDPMEGRVASLERSRIQTQTALKLVAVLGPIITTVLAALILRLLHAG